MMAEVTEGHVIPPKTGIEKTGIEAKTCCRNGGNEVAVC